jgi:hypothetical protein
MYTIYQMTPAQVTFMLVGTEDTLPEAIKFARNYHGLKKEDVTLTVEIEGTRLPVASFSTRRITGHFTKQAWGGRRGDDAVYCGEEDFDATRYILSMPYKDVVRIRDNNDTSDDIGMAHVSWVGPHEVEIVDSMCDFFGVSKLEEITEEHFNFVVENRQHEAHRDRLGILYPAHAAAKPQQIPQRIASPAEAARDLIISLSKLTIPGEAGPDGKVRAPDGAAAQMQLASLIRQCREILAQAETLAQRDAEVQSASMDPEEQSLTRP